jgi:hypothetical protein
MRGSIACVVVRNQTSDSGSPTAPSWSTRRRARPSAAVSTRILAWSPASPSRAAVCFHAASRAITCRAM